MNTPTRVGRESLRDPPAPPGAIPAPLPRSFYDRPSTELAPALLGRLLVRATPAGLVTALIVETEAYAGPEDRASHARAGRTRRTAPMFGPPGHAYVYLVYGLHHCLNVVAGPDGHAGAVLVRAAWPVSGIELMRAGRGAVAGPDERLASGPARLCQALAIDRTLDGHDLTRDGELVLADPLDGFEPGLRIVTGRRVGVDYAGPGWADRRWRFGIRDHPALSRRFGDEATA